MFGLVWSLTWFSCFTKLNDSSSFGYLRVLSRLWIEKNYCCSTFNSLADYVLFIYWGYFSFFYTLSGIPSNSRFFTAGHHIEVTLSFSWAMFFIAAWYIWSFFLNSMLYTRSLPWSCRDTICTKSSLLSELFFASLKISCDLSRNCCYVVRATLLYLPTHGYLPSLSDVGSRLWLALRSQLNS